MVTQLDRSVISFSHSEVITFRWLTGSTVRRETNGAGPGGTVSVVAVMPLRPSM